MFTAIISLLTGSLGGGLLNALSQGINIFRESRERKYELARMKLEAGLKIALKKAHVEGEIDLTEAEAFVEGQKASGRERPLVQTVYIEEMLKHWYTAWLATLLVVLMGLIDVVKTAIRPGLAIYVVGIATYFGYLMYMTLNASLSSSGQVVDAVKAMAMVEMMVASIFHLTGIVVGYYFSDRTNAKFIREQFKRNNPVQPEELRERIERTGFLTRMKGKIL